MRSGGRSRAHHGAGAAPGPIGPFKGLRRAGGGCAPRARGWGGTPGAGWGRWGTPRPGRLRAGTPPCARPDLSRGGSLSPRHAHGPGLCRAQHPWANEALSFCCLLARLTPKRSLYSPPEAPAADASFLGQAGFNILFYFVYLFFIVTAAELSWHGHASCTAPCSRVPGAGEQP